MAQVFSLTIISFHFPGIPYFFNCSDSSHGPSCFVLKESRKASSDEYLRLDLRLDYPVRLLGLNFHPCTDRHGEINHDVVAFAPCVFYAFSEFLTQYRAVNENRNPGSLAPSIMQPCSTVPAQSRSRRSLSLSSSIGLVIVQASTRLRQHVRVAPGRPTVIVSNFHQREGRQAVCP